MSETRRHIFTGMKILSEQQWLDDHALVVEDSTIKAIIPDEMIAHHLPAIKHEYTKNHLLVPGFVDLHVHGAKGCDVMDATQEAFSVISQALAAEGVTGFLATTMTAGNEQMERVLGLIPEAMAIVDGAAILGVHLEGPFIAKAKMGAQLGDNMSLPDPERIKQWQKLSKGAIKLVTLAPELPGAIPLIETLKSMQIITSIGHTDASYQETMTAINAGCTQATHLFNAMRGLHQREPGAVGALLLSDNINAELIVDGVHLHPAIVDMVLRLKGKDSIMLVTDAMRAKCLGNGKYDLGGQMVDVKEGKATLEGGVLAGSTLRMPEAIKNMVEFTHCSLADAVYMASGSPIAKLGLFGRKGSIAKNKDADLVVLDEEMKVKMTMREGKQIFASL